MKYRLLMSTVAFVVIVLCVMLSVSSAAEQIAPPELYVPKTVSLKMELSLPAQTKAGNAFNGDAYIKKVYPALANESITSISGIFIYNSELFGINDTTYSGDNYKVEINKNGFSLTFAEAIHSDGLTDVSFPISFTAASYSSNKVTSFDRVYIAIDRVSIVSKDGTAYEGIGGIGYTEFFCAVESSSIEMPPIPFDESSEALADTSNDESTVISREESDEEFSDEFSYESSDHESSEEPSEPISHPNITEERFDEFLDAYRINVDGEYLMGWKPNTSFGDIYKEFPEITVIDYNPTGEHYISTRDILLFFDDDGNLYRKYSCVVKGDLDGNGKINAADYIMLRLAILKLVDLSEESSLAADISGNGKIAANDYIMLRLYILKKIDIFDN